MRKKRWYTLCTFIVVALLACNNYFLFRTTSNVERVYYESEYEIVAPATYTHLLPKYGVIAPRERMFISENNSDLNDVTVVEGQAIFIGDALAYYSTQKQAIVVEQLQGEVDAYTQEVSILNRALNEIEMLGDRFDPASSISSRQFEDSLSVTIQAEIMQEQSTSGAIAILQQHIAATERNLQIAQTALNAASAERALISPINGIISSITNDAGTITFELLSEDKQILAFVTEEEWQDVQLEQAVEITLYQDERDDLLQGTVTEKQALPAVESPWYTLLRDKQHINEDEVVYEIHISINDLLLDQPLGVFSQNDITINVFDNTHVAPRSWIAGNVEMGLGKIRTLYYNGRIQLKELFIHDVIDGNLVQALPPIEEELLNEEQDVEEFTSDEESVEETTGEPTIESEAVIVMQEEHYEKVVYQDPTLTRIKTQLNNHEEIVIFESFSDQKTVILPRRDGLLYVKSFVPMRFETFTFDRTGRVDWKDAVKYLFY